MNWMGLNFGKKAVETVKDVAVLEKPVKQVKVKQEKIDSKFIQKDLHLTLDKLLAEVGVNISRESKIEELKQKKVEFKEQNEKLYKKISTLNSLGFTSTPSVKKQKEELEKQETVIKEQITKLGEEIKYYEDINEVVAKYSMQYPGYKFIPTAVMTEILKKYNLFLSHTCFYGREIPDDALEIAGYFTSEINESKRTIDVIRTSHSFGYTHNVKVRPKPKKMDFDVMSGYDRTYVLDPRSGRGMHSYDTVLHSFGVSKLRIVAPMDHFTIPEVDFQEWRGDDVKVPIVKIDKDNCLRVSVDKLNAKELENAKKRAVEDPILCLKVDKGFIVLKAWDKEADIIEIQNPMSN